jgi:rhamnosyltransferase
VLEARDVVLDHMQGRWERRRLLWRKPRVNDYNAARRYYQARNRIVLYANFGRFDPRWALCDVQGVAWDFLKLILLCENRGAKLLAILAGIRDALRGRMGPKPP